MSLRHTTADENVGQVVNLSLIHGNGQDNILS